MFLCQLSCKLPRPLITNESHLWPSPWKFYKSTIFELSSLSSCFPLCLSSGYKILDLVHNGQASTLPWKYMSAWTVISYIYNIQLSICIYLSIYLYMCLVVFWVLVDILLVTRSPWCLQKIQGIEESQILDRFNLAHTTFCSLKDPWRLTTLVNVVAAVVWGKGRSPHSSWPLESALVCTGLHGVESMTEQFHECKEQA